MMTRHAVGALLAPLLLSAPVSAQDVVSISGVVTMRATAHPFRAPSSAGVVVPTGATPEQVLGCASMIARLGLVLGVVSLQGLAAMSGIGDFRRGSGSGSGCPGFGCPDYRTPDYRIPDYRTPDNPSPIPASAAARTSGSEPGPASQETAPAVRVSVEVIPIDVQVLDCHGKPVTGLGAEKFSVTINGRRDRVLSANMIQTAPAPHAATAAALDAGPPGAEALRAGRRVIVLAIDCISFSPGTVQIAVDHARQFIARLPADDLVGLFAYPIGADIDPTTDRAKVSRALDTVVGSATWAW